MFKTFIPALFRKNRGFTPHHFSGKNVSQIKTTKSGAGFTLIELMVVSSIILILTAVVLINYRAGNQQLALDRSAHKLAQDIRRAQEMAMSPREDCASVGDFRGSYGIYLHRNIYPRSYLLFADCNDDKAYDATNDQILEELPFEKDVTFTGARPNPAAGPAAIAKIIFSSPDPTVTLSPGPGEPLEVVLSINSQEKSIYINNAGLIYVE